MSRAATPQGVETDIPPIKRDNSASKEPEQPGAHNPTGTTQLAQPDSSDDEFDHGSEDDIDITADVPQVSWRCVSVNTRGMSRANSDLWLIWVIIAAHLLRQGDEGFRCRHPNDPDLHHLNSILVGPSSAAEAVDLAHTLLQGHTRQWNSVMAWTFVVTLTKELDTLESWLAVLLWIQTNPTTAGLPIVLAVVHRDQNGFAHMHIALVPVRNGKRIGKPEPAVLRGSFNQFCKDRFGFNLNPPEKRREARKEKTKKAQSLGDFAAKSGAGPKGRAAANRRDAELVSRVDPETGEIVPTASSALAVVSWATDWYNPTGTTRLVKENFRKWPSCEKDSPAGLCQTGHTQLFNRPRLTPTKPRQALRMAPVGGLSSLDVARADDGVSFGIPTGASPGFQPCESIELNALLEKLAVTLQALSAAHAEIRSLQAKHADQELAKLPLVSGPAPAPAAALAAPVLDRLTIGERHTARWIAENRPNGRVTASDLRRGKGSRVNTLPDARRLLSALASVGLLSIKPRGNTEDASFEFVPETLLAALAGKAVTPIPSERRPTQSIDMEAAEP